MDPSIAVDVVYGNLSEEEREKEIEKMIGDLTPYPAAGDYYLQDIVEPTETRQYLSDILRIIRDSEDKGMSKRHLANWPKKF